MKFSTLLKLMRFWPPFLGSGIRVKSFNSDYLVIEVQMKMRFWNRNYVGSHFGGSLYSMTDPFYMLMVLNKLGKNYIVWDKSGSIRYKKPAKGSICAKFELTIEQLEKIKEQADSGLKCEPVFEVLIKDSKDQFVAEVTKTLSIKRK
jgi:hypothetical protein